jgi:hypothetical protein
MVTESLPPPTYLIWANSLYKIGNIFGCLIRSSGEFFLQNQKIPHSSVSKWQSNGCILSLRPSFCCLLSLCSSKTIVLPFTSPKGYICNSSIQLLYPAPEAIQTLPFCDGGRPAPATICSSSIQLLYLAPEAIQPILLMPKVIQPHSFSYPRPSIP